MAEDEFLTLRERIYLLLKESPEPLDARTIASHLGLPDSERGRVEEALRHLYRSVKRRSGGMESLEVVPARCLDCGYVFPKKEGEFKKPSKCPRCKSQRIEGPWFYIRSKKK